MNGTLENCYSSVVVIESAVLPGVRYHIRKMSFGRRLDLLRRIRDLARRREFLAAGSDPLEGMEARLLQGEIDKVYVSWGLNAIEGFEIDGTVVSAERFAEDGPEELFVEALMAIQRETGLSESERKN